MDIKQYFAYESNEIPPENIFLLTEQELDNLYVKSNEVERFNIFFHLQNEYFFLERNKRLQEAAYVCYLISYYLFTPLTPPHSEILAFEYAKKAIELCAEQKYQDWIEEVKCGN